MLLLRADRCSRRPTARRCTPLWTLTGDFASPESAYYDAASNSIFVSSINGQILEKDGNGYISRLSPDGKVVSAKWVTGLNAPKGMRSAGRHALGDRHRRGRGHRHRERAHYRAREGRWRSVPQRSGDGAGRHRLRIGLDLARIYAVKDGKSSVFVEGADRSMQPNGLLVDGTRLILGTIGPRRRSRTQGRVAAQDRHRAGTSTPSISRPSSAHNSRRKPSAGSTGSNRTVAAACWSPT